LGRKTTREKRNKGRGEEAKERLCANLTKGRSGIPESGIPSGWKRNAIWRWSETFQRVTRRLSSRGHNERPSGQMNKIGIAATAIGIKKTWTKKPQRTEIPN